MLLLVSTSKDVAKNEKETTHISVPKEPLKIGKGTVNVVSIARTPEMSRSRKGSRWKKKEGLVQESEEPYANMHYRAVIVQGNQESFFSTNKCK